MAKEAVVKDKSSPVVTDGFQESGTVPQDLVNLRSSLSDIWLEKIEATEPNQDDVNTKVSPADGDNNKSEPKKKALGLRDLQKYLPKELRRKVWTAYLQAPPDHFVPPNIKQLMKPVDDLRKTDKTMYKEIIESTRWVSSIAQHLVLDSCFDHVDNIVKGFPKAVMYCEDWLNLQYLAIKIEFCDLSRRDTQGLCTGIRLGITSNAMGAFHHLFDMIWDNHELPKLKQVRYDLEYVDDLSRDPTCSALSLTILIKLFPMAESIWAEAVGHETNACLLEAVRGLNVAYRVWKRCPPRPQVLDLITSTGGQGDDFDYRKFEVIPWLGSEDLKEADACMELAPRKDYNVQRGINMELKCEGCFATFNNSRPITMWPEEKFLTKKLYDNHVARGESFNNNALGCGVDKVKEAKQQGLILDDEYIAMDKQVAVEGIQDVKWGFVTKKKQKKMEGKKKKKSGKNAEEKEASIDNFWSSVMVD